MHFAKRHWAVKLRIKLFILSFLLLPFTSAQKYFNDTLHFNSDNTTFLSMVLPTDTGIFVAGNKFMDSTGYDGYLLLGFIDTNKNSREVFGDYDPDNFQMLGGSTYKLFINTSGNFVLAYSNVKDTNEYPRIKEVSPQGQLLRDIRLDTVIEMGLFVKDFTRIYQHTDSSYWLWSISSFVENASPIQQHAGPLLTILDKNFNVDTIIRYYFDPQKKWDYYFKDEIELENGKTVVLMQNILFPIPNSGEGLKSSISIFYLDKTGLITYSSTYQNNFLTGAAPTLIRSNDSTKFATLINQAERIGDTTLGLVYLGTFDNNFQLEQLSLINSTKALTSSWPFGFGPKRIITTSDSNYLTLCTDYPLSGKTNQTAERICKVSPTGDILWQRDFWYFTAPETGFDGNYHNMVDVRECPDGGFVFPGTITGNTFQVGWLVKTNCLGFLGPPEVAFAYKNSLTADSTYFYNTSVQAGSYFWDFGDGTTLNTDEYADTLVHQYADTGYYNITLIGYGCNGETDTLRYEVHVTPPPIKDSTTTQVGEGYFTFFPNPVQTGNTLYVYLNGSLEQNASTIELNFYNNAGKIVQSTSISSKKGYYTISNTLSSGLYFVHLTQNGNNIAVKKLVVM